MSTKVIKGDLSITRDNHNNINIRVKDRASGSQFLEVTLSPEDFAMAVTGCHLSDVKMEVHYLDVVGKQKWREKRTVFCPLKSYDDKLLRNWLETNCQEEGWFLNSYLGSQNSKRFLDNGVELNYSVYSYIDI